MKHSVTETKLKNGAKGLLIDVPDASVMSFNFNFRAGEYLADPEKWEVPHLMEHILLGANELYPKARDFQAELEKNGAYSNASTGVYDITYEAESADFEWDRVLDLMLEAIARPLFLEEEFRAEYGNVEEEIAARSNNHFRRLSLELRQASGLLAKTDAERLKLMPNVEIDDIKKHYRRTHVAPNLRFVIAGNLRGRRAAIERKLSSVGLPGRGKRFELPDECPRQVEAPVFVPNHTVENLYFYIDTFMQRRLTDPESYALGLANTLLTETLYSKILGTARERGLVYGMSSGVSQVKQASNWWFGAQVSNKNAPALFEIIVEEIEKLKQGKVEMSEIEAAKQYSLGRHQRSAQTVGGVGYGYAGRYFFEEIIDDYYRVPEHIASIKKATMVGVAREIFMEDTWCFGALGNCEPEFTNHLHNLLLPLWQSPVRSK